MVKDSQAMCNKNTGKDISRNVEEVWLLAAAAIENAIFYILTLTKELDSLEIIITDRENMVKSCLANSMTFRAVSRMIKRGYLSITKHWRQYSFWNW